MYTTQQQIRLFLKCENATELLEVKTTLSEFQNISGFASKLYEKLMSYFLDKNFI
ncbi:hypothetical protein [Flavobacterium sp.]|uniref:hypothetical protein n=1 Tax=Flavobacterium sp. TaxID=239 RepID=UPI004047C6D0